MTAPGALAGSLNLATKYQLYGCADRVLQFVIVKADILVRAVFHPEAAGDGSEQSEAKPFIQVTGVNIVLHNGVELQEPEMELRGLRKTVGHQLFADMLTPHAESTA